MKKQLLTTILLVLSLAVQAQRNIVLLGTDTESGEKIACTSISLYPGFVFSSGSGKSLVLRVDPENCSPHGGQSIQTTQSQNYIQTRTFTSEDGKAFLDQVQYFDGLGRPNQTVMAGAAPNYDDLVSLQEYDAFGRESNVWLPALSSGYGAYVSAATLKENSKTLNKDDSPFSKPVYEASPLNRILKQFGPGQNWHSSDKAVETNYKTNTASGELSCINFETTGIGIVNDELFNSGNYNAGELFVTEVIDEDGNKAYEFKDKLGQVVLSRQMNSGEAHDTYYVYDDFGNLTYVLPPIIANTKDAGYDFEHIKQYAYAYGYDQYNRCYEKRLPGCEPIYYIYDKADRLILSQDGEQRKENKWAFNCYDEFGRIIFSGLHHNANNKTHTELTNMFKDIVVKESSGYWFYGYSVNTLFQLLIPNVCNGLYKEVLAVNYYDDYRYVDRTLGIADQEAQPSGFKGKEYASAKGLLTGTIQFYNEKKENFDHCDNEYKYTASVIRYDDRGRVIQTKSTNHLGGVEKEYVGYNFVGAPTKKLHVHSAKDQADISELYTYSYDHAGRLLETKHELNNSGEKVLLAKNKYDELGRLEQNRKGNHDQLATSFSYDIRSRSEKILSGHFHEYLSYTYGSNIKSMSWTDNGQSRTYNFDYDNLSRLTKANFEGVGKENYSTEYSYDKHGNMKNLKRHGKTEGGLYGLLDDLAMEHTGNQLKNISDAGEKIMKKDLADFKNYSNIDTEYHFNANGAMTKDFNKGISEIRYNSLNLPREMDIKSPVAEARNEYLYSVSGQKLRVTHNWNPNFSQTPIIGSDVNTSLLASKRVTDYVGNKIYEDNKLKRILIDGGYVENGAYHFYQTDHLGNNRIVATANGNVIQRTHYYPFGMAFAEAEGQDKQPYKYNGKELDTDHGLNLYDYSARYYDPGLPIFTTVDPLAEKKPWISPYVYCRNNPLRFIDPDGREEYEYDEDGNKKVISNIGDDLGIRIYHTGVKDKNGKEMSILIDKEGNSVTMTGGREIFKGGESRDADVDYGVITHEFVIGNGPERSIFEGDHPANNAIQGLDSYQEKKTKFEYTNANTSKKSFRVDWGITDVFTTPDGQAQMMGSYNVSFYRLGNKTLNVAIDSKSKTSLFYHFPFVTNTPRGAGGSKPLTATHQIYMFWSK